MPKYTQKYCLVSFIDPLSEGSEFDMTTWSLHTTLADVFAVPDVTKLYQGLEKLAEEHLPLRTVAGRDIALGSPQHPTYVTCLEKTPEMQRFHDAIVDILEANGALFNSPQFTRTGYLPHVTIQSTGRINRGQEVTVGQFAVIDMFVGGHMSKRKVIKVIAPNAASPQGR